MSRPVPPPAPRRASISWWLAAALVLAPLAAEMGHTCLGPLAQEGLEGLVPAASPATAAARPRSTCPGCLHHLQGVGAMPVPLHLPGPGGVRCSPALAPRSILAGAAVDSAPARAPPGA